MWRACSPTSSEKTATGEPGAEVENTHWWRKWCGWWEGLKGDGVQIFVPLYATYFRPASDSGADPDGYFFYSYIIILLCDDIIIITYYYGVYSGFNRHCWRSQMFFEQMTRRWSDTIL